MPFLCYDVTRADNSEQGQQIAEVGSIKKAKENVAVQARLNFRTVEMPGEHGKGVFRVRLQPDVDAAQNAMKIQDRPVVLQETKPDGSVAGMPLFSGYPEKIRIFRTGGYQEAELTVMSGTVLYDRRERSRVFQKPGQSYGEIVRRMAGETENGACILTVPDRKSGEPFFQYQETDWEFAKRVAGRLGLPLVADSGFHYPRFYIGVRNGEMKEIPAGSSRTLSFDGERFYRMKGQGLDVVREDFFCYHITTWAKLELGERVRMDGRELAVNRKEMMLQDGEVTFRYRLAGRSYGSTGPKENTDMIGISLPGKVTETTGQTCRLELDLEPGQPEGYAYPFAPETGNMMYCMPQKGTRVSLKLGSGTGADAMVSACIRTNGAECEGTSQPSQKSFHTEYGRGMELYPGQLGLTGGGTGKLLLEDAAGASLTTAGNLIAYAKGSIVLESGKRIDMETLSGIFAEAFQAATSSFCVNGRFDYLSAGTVLQGRTYLAYPPFDDAPKEGHFDWGGFFRNIGIGLAVAAVCVIAAAVVIGTAGGAAAVFAAGAAVGTKVAVGALVGAAVGATMTTASMAVEDFNDGDVRSWQEASREIGISTISGAITGAVGARFPQMNKLLAGLIDTAASTVERGFLKAFEEDITIGEWFAYTFDPGTIALDFASGVLIDCLIDEAADLFKGRKPARLVDGVTEQVSDAVGDSVTRETREAIEDAVGDSVSRETREAVEDAVGDSVGRETKEAVEDAVGDTTGEILDDFDEYEQFYEDMFDRQRETCREYEDFLDDLRELQREGMGEGLDIPLPDSSMTPGMKDAVGDAVAEGGGDTIKSGRETVKIDEFFIDDWTGYPDAPKPDGPFRILEGTEYTDARNLANKTNANIHRNRPDLKGTQIHEMHPVKLGGSPTDIDNKIALSPKEHAKYTAFWNKVLREQKGKLK